MTSGFDGDRQRDQGIHGLQSAGPRPGAGEHGQDVKARRVIDHVAEVRPQRGILDEAPAALDVVDEQQVMREIRSAADRQQLRPRQPQQPRRDRNDRDAPSRGRRSGRHSTLGLSVSKDSSDSRASAARQPPRSTGTRMGIGCSATPIESPPNARMMATAGHVTRKTAAASARVITRATVALPIPRSRTMGTTRSARRRLHRQGPRVREADPDAHPRRRARRLPRRRRGLEVEHAVVHVQGHPVRDGRVQAARDVRFLEARSGDGVAARGREHGLRAADEGVGSAAEESAARPT